MAQSTANSRRNKPTKRGKSRRARKEEAQKAILSVARSTPSQPTHDADETPVPSSKVRKREPAPVLEADSVVPALPAFAASTSPTLEAEFLLRERVFFEHDVSIADELEVEAAPLTMVILARRLRFRRLVLRIMVALAAFAVLALAISFVRTR